MTYSSTGGGGARGTTYADLMMQTDASGQGLSYLATEDKFAFLKDLETRNLVVPVVGNFAGPKALRAVGTYLKEHGVTVTAFYVSNVEQYLRQDGIWPSFCANVQTLPLDESSVFIRPGGGRMMRYGPFNGGVRSGGGFRFGAPPAGATPALPIPLPPLASPLGAMATEVKTCSAAASPQLSRR
jgi:hypothetical protein